MFRQIIQRYWKQLNTRKRSRRYRRDTFHAEISRHLRIESLEDRRVLAATVDSTSFLATGTLNAGTTTITVTFSEPVLEANQSSNYELRKAGADGLLLT
ncbi:MAG TPA: hypothetical protein VMM76_00190, partial [Pirellulaceae bacterium]|nr:hypothetical protein [Pirellulaceae bacterium]